MANRQAVIFTANGKKIMSTNNKQHWENVYNNKQPHEVSWTQNVPTTSLELIASLNLPLDAAIIDIGGGDSHLVDNLLQQGYTDITVLDISGAALERAKKRLGDNADKINWIETDITDYKPNRKYHLWHDRAAFHFLTNEADKQQYINMVNNTVDGYMIIGTFSDNGPKKCSGLDICQYSPSQMANTFAPAFSVLSTQTLDHTTPFNTTQNFTFCSFKKN